MLDGVLFGAPGDSDTVVIAITGIHGNFYSNPFYVNFGQTLNEGGIDFVYAQTCDAFGQIRTKDWRTGKQVIIGSQTEDFNDTVDDVGAYVNWASDQGYSHIYLGDHSLGANKVIRYLSETHDPRVERFILLSPANLTHMTSVTSEDEKQLVCDYMASGREEEMLPLALMGWPYLPEERTRGRRRAAGHREPLAERSIVMPRPYAYIEASVFANEDHAGYRAFSTEVAKAFFEVLNIPVNRIFARYDDIPVWSVGGMVADRTVFC